MKYIFISEFFKNFLKDNIDLWNNVKFTLFYFTILNSIQTLLIIYYITKMEPQHDKLEEYEECEECE